MIPKIIHYCWLSDDPYPEKIKNCINSWKEHLPDYEFMLWNFDRFPKSKSLWVEQAFKYHKYAFAADYIRLYALYHYGGFYLDMDVEVKKSFNSLLGLDTAICWQKDVPGLEVAAFGVKPKCSWIKDCLDRYDHRPFIRKDGVFDVNVLPEVVEKQIHEKGYLLKCVSSIPEAIKIQSSKTIPVFPPEFFSPKSYVTQKTLETDNTYCIHHFEGSWKKMMWYESIDKWLIKQFGIRKNLLSGFLRIMRKLFVKHQ